MNPPQPPQPCPANHPHDHSFSLIIERVPGDDLAQDGFVFEWRSAFSAAIIRSPMNWGFSPRGTSLLAQEITKESIPQLPRRSFHADVFFLRMPRHVVAVGEKLQIVLASQPRDEFLIRIG